MTTVLLEMQENQQVSERRIDKDGFIHIMSNHIKSRHRL